MPHEMETMAITQNPSNSNEIISFGQSLNDEGFIYNIKTDKYKKFDFKFDFKKYCCTNLDFLDADPVISQRVDTNDTNIIILGSFGFYYQFCCVFDPINNRLKPIINKNCNNLNKYYCLSSNYKFDATSDPEAFEMISKENLCNLKN